MSSGSASTWVKFFTSAGIPNPTNASYAHIFVENRIQMDMLSELNKEHLKEMGITPMGDIISILRHSKNVNDESVRSKILKSNVDLTQTMKKKTAVATIRPASPVSKKVISSVAVPQPRRVLPEQEGKYKVFLPKGSTQKTREIMAKHSAMQMDKYEKKSVFDRLRPGADVDMDGSSNDSIVRINKVSSSIFNRLGDFDNVKKNIERQSVAFSGILKTSPITQTPKGVVKRKLEQRVMIKKPPPQVKAKVVVPSDSDSDYTDEKMDSDDYKQVSFSPDVEVLEIESLDLRSNVKKGNLKGLRTDGIKNRLGEIKIRRSVDGHNDHLHNIKKTITMKPNRSQSSSPIKSSGGGRMKSDLKQTIAIKSRLDLKKRSSHPSSESRFNKPNSGRVKKPSNVFNRLGKKH